MKVQVLIAAAALMLGATCAKGDLIPYPNGGTIAPTNNFTATATGFINAYFYGFSAGHLDVIEIKDLTQNTTTGNIFPNQSTPVGSSMTLAVNMGDILEFVLHDLTSGQNFSSIPGNSDDGINHAYATPYTATGATAIAGIPPGIFVGMEDLPLGSSDLDYNDDQFVFTNVATTPEPGSLFLLGTGLLALAKYGRRKLRA
jgi:hypothetical protein